MGRPELEWVQPFELPFAYCVVGSGTSVTGYYEYPARVTYGCVARMISDPCLTDGCNFGAGCGKHIIDMRDTSFLVG
jgi:hypothetical protein